MHWLEKINRLYELYLRSNRTGFIEWGNSSLYCDFFNTKGAPPFFLDRLQSGFPILDKELLEFVKLYNGPAIEDFRFLGSDELGQRAIFTYLKYLPHKQEVPFAIDSTGDIYYLSSEKKVLFISPKLDERPTFICHSFGEFMEEYVLGKKYKTLYDEDEFYDFLKAQGWA